MSTSARKRLNRTAILEVAIELVDREGPKGLTMRRLGAELGVEAMSLYNHVANKQDVLDGMAGLLVSRMTDFTVLDEDWKQDAARLARAYRSTTKQHANVFMLAAGRPLVSGDDQDQFHAILNWLHDAGFSPDLALDFMNSIAALVRGFALGESLFGDETAADGTEWNDDRAFERGLQAMIEGFSHEVEREK